MTVWTVWRFSYDGDEVVSVHATKKKAQKVLDDLNRVNKDVANFSFGMQEHKVIP